MAPGQMLAATSSAGLPMVINYDEFSDLRLEIGGSATSFMVCSRAMARSSPAFRAMLYGCFTEAKPKTGEWIVRLPEDEPRAFAVLLDIIHGRTDRVPPDLDEALPPFDCTATLLYNVVRMADKYCLLPLLRPWINPWLALWRPGGLREDERWTGEIIAVAWIVGDEALLVGLLDNAVESMRLQRKAYKGRGLIRDDRGRKFRLGDMPDGPNKVLDLEGLSEVIVEARKRSIEQLAEPLVSLSSNPERYMPGASQADMDMFLEALVENTRSAYEIEGVRPPLSWWDTSTLAAYKGTVFQLYNIIKCTLELFLDEARSKAQGLSRCTLDAIMPRIYIVENLWMDQESVRLTEEHKAHLKRRRHMSGVKLNWQLASDEDDDDDNFAI